ncbi:MAG: glycosyltransferase family 2 protein [Rhodobacteraceae bacterium]|nr:glycosyltransferase family 2 protein [Paracoccaceae bacterium]
MLKFTFVITHYAESATHLELLERTMRSLFAQSDPDWSAVVIDDASPLETSFALLESWRDRARDRIFLERTLVSGGAGAARNIAIRRAAALGADAVLLNDNDDLSHPERLARTKAAFLRNRGLDFLYTGLRPIDAEDRDIPDAETRLDILEIMEALRADPPEGASVFAPMAAETGCLIIPSTAALKTSLALEHRFPGGFASEDNHTWMRMAAAGANFAYLRDTPIGYRIWRQETSDLGVNGRNRKFLWEKARNDIDGFECGVLLALERGTLAHRDVAPLAQRFLDRVATCVGRQGEADLAAQLRSDAFLKAQLARLPHGRAVPAITQLRPTG